MHTSRMGAGPALRLMQSRVHGWVQVKSGASQSEDHVRRRETRLGRWFPAAAYLVNYLLWVATGIHARAFDFPWLSILPLPALILYLVRSLRNGRSA